MKTCKFCFCFFLTFLLQVSGRGQSYTAPFDTQQEQAEIIRTLEGESACYYAGDYDCWQSYWVQDSTTASFVAGEGLVYGRVSWDAHSEGAKNDIKNREGFYASKVRQENYRFVFMAPTAAAVYFDGYHYGEKDSCTYSREIRILEKRNGQWKLVLMTTLYDAKRGCGG
jgi:hypothetical protein